MDEPDILNIEEASDYLRVSVPTLKLEAKAGRVPSFKIGRQYRFKRTELTKLMEGGQTWSVPAGMMKATIDITEMLKAAGA